VAAAAQTPQFWVLFKVFLSQNNKQRTFVTSFGRSLNCYFWGLSKGKQFPFYMKHPDGAADS